MKTLTIGSLSDCDLVVEGDEVSPIHAHVQAGSDGFLTVVDAGSEHGTFLHRNNQWIRILKVNLSSGDRIRCADTEVNMSTLMDLFGGRVRVQLRDHQALRLPALLAERLAAKEARAAFERPRRNPETGNIEEDS